jgi:hypothetical protein
MGEDFMPIKNSTQKNPDLFVMNEDTVNIAVTKYLTSKGFICDKPLTGRQTGVDVKARKGDFTILVESKGSQKNHAEEDEVFNHGQIVNHLARQIHTLMKYANEYDNEKTLFVLANPDIERIRKEYLRVNKMIEKMGFVCMWVQEEKSVVVEVPEKVKGMLYKFEF